MLRVVTTVAPITSIVAAVAGDRVKIDGLVPEGTNSHTFDPPPSAAKVLSEADVIFVNGLKLEDPTSELAESNKKADAEVVEIGTTVLPESDYIYDFSFPKEEGKPNPHLWTDPTFAIKYAAVARDALAEADPGNADYFRVNYTAFEKQATQLSDALRADQASIPGGKRELLTYHDAYAYFAKTYDWKVIGAIQPENFEDPTPQEVAGLIDQIKTEEVPVIFGSEVFPSKVLEEVGRATGARYEDTLRDDDLPRAGRGRALVGGSDALRLRHGDLRSRWAAHPARGAEHRSGCAGHYLPPATGGPAPQGHRRRHAFDPEVADVSGVRVARTDALLMLVLSLSILATLTVIGVTLVAATLVIPAVVARMLTNRFSRMLWLPTVIGATCGLVGMNLSYHLDVPSGTTIVLTGAVVFGVVLAATGGRRLQRTAQLDSHAEPAPTGGAR